MSTSEMTFTELSWVSPDRARFYAVEWRPTRPRAAVLLIHGLGEHCRRYDPIAAAYCGAGIGVVSYDQRGHGRTTGTRGHFPSMEKVLDDIDHFLLELDNRYPGVPHFLYGHSLGGMEVLDHAMVRKPSIKGVVCTSPGLATGQPVSKAKLFIGNLLYSILPEMTMPNGLDVENISHNPAIVSAYKNDPLVHPMISARLGLDLINTGRWVEEHGEDFALPLLLMQGSADHLVSPEATRRFAARVPRDLITYHEWPGLYHELHNENQRAEVLAEMTDWIAARL
jgi:alpha-beta hydrolase superfamily lysophospholipase